MWMRAVRNGLSSRAVAALLAALVYGSAFDWGHAGGDDRDCDIVVVHHDHAAHRLTTAPTAPVSTDHCYICHSLRLLHHAAAGCCERVIAPPRRVQQLDREVAATCDGLRFGVASRAPPSARL
jgi:hypothetical protein